MVILSTDKRTCESKNAVPLAEGHGANAHCKAELKAHELYTLLDDVEATANLLDAFGLTIAQQRVLAELIDLADDLSPDADLEPWLGWTDTLPVFTNPPVLKNGWPVRVFPYETNSFQDDREDDPADAGELTEQGFQNIRQGDEFCGLTFSEGAA